MKTVSMTAAAVALGLACAMPVMAQGSGTTASTGSTLSSQPADASSTTMSSQPADSSSTTLSSQPSDTRTMGAGPEEIEVDNDRDMGWIGLLGLAGLLGLRRRQHHDDHRHDVRGAPMR